MDLQPEYIRTVNPFEKYRKKREETHRERIRVKFEQCKHLFADGGARDRDIRKFFGVHLNTSARYLQEFEFFGWIVRPGKGDFRHWKLFVGRKS